jgi:type II secretory ATPase GspE/PulE/Tfp pilus assembly ATPase PilB-like protein
VDVKVLRDLVARVAAAGAPETNTIYAVVVALGAIGLALAVLAVWLMRQTQPERELLAPLERMHDRSWRKQEPAQMRRDLDEVRPAHARPAALGRDVPEVDDEFAQSQPRVVTFDDLRAQHASDTKHESSDRSVAGADPLSVTRAVAELMTDGTPSAGSDIHIDIDQSDETNSMPLANVADGEPVGTESAD